MADESMSHGELECLPGPILRLSLRLHLHGFSYTIRPDDVVNVRCVF